MRNWGANIVIDAGSPRATSAPTAASAAAGKPAAARAVGVAADEGYEQRIEAVLRQIAGNPVGRILLGAFDNLHNKVFLRPPAAAGPRSLEQPADSIDRSASRRAAARELTLRYDPTRLDPVAMQLPNPGHDWRADDMLFHECVHALRQVMGVWRRTPMAEWRDREEFYAALLTNIYLWQGGRQSDMRGDHAAIFKPMAESLRYAYSADARDNLGRGFAAKYNDEILALRNEMFGLYMEIAKLPFGWNPLRETERHWNPGHGHYAAAPSIV
jgi:hypothetical protein